MRRAGRGSPVRHALGSRSELRLGVESAFRRISGASRRGVRLQAAPWEIPVMTRKLGPFDVSAIGLGCMSMSHAYGTPPPPDVAAGVLRRALDLGYTHIDTAALYGFGANETLVGNALSDRRREFLLASKGGMFR